MKCQESSVYPLASQSLAERQTCIHLNRRFRRAEAFAIEPRPIEAANASLPGSEHRAGIFDPTRASLWPLGGGDPVDPISARDGRDVRPQHPRFRGGLQSLPQTCLDPGFTLLSHL